MALIFWLRIVAALLENCEFARNKGSQHPSAKVFLVRFNNEPMAYRQSGSADLLATLAVGSRKDEMALLDVG